MAQSSLEIWSKGQTDLRSLSGKVLQRRLAETIAWCDSRAWPSDLRSPEIEPNLFHEGRDDLVCDVGRSRELYLRHRHLPIVAGPPQLGGGRLLIYFPDITLSDGMAEASSEGFFDVFNLPPFDTWVTFFEDKTLGLSFQNQLLCYVPVRAVELADEGIEANPEECILWLEQTPGTTKERIGELLGGLS